MKRNKRNRDADQQWVFFFSSLLCNKNSERSDCGKLKKKKTNEKWKYGRRMRVRVKTVENSMWDGKNRQNGKKSRTVLFEQHTMF